jgi:hypothetical protein
MYVCDFTTAQIRRLTFDAAGVATVSTIPLKGGKFARPRRMVHDGHGSLYVTDIENNTVSRVSTKAEDYGSVEVVAGAGHHGYLDGPGKDALFSVPAGISLIPGSGDLLVADSENHRLRRVELSRPDHRVTTVMGTSTAFRVDGPMTPVATGATLDENTHPGASLFGPDDVGFDPAGSLFVLEAVGHALEVVPKPFTSDAHSRLVAGGGLAANQDGFYSNANLDLPTGMAIRSDGFHVLTDVHSHSVLLVSPDGWVKSIAGSGRFAGESGMVDGPGAMARFNRPEGVVVVNDGTQDVIYVADAFNQVIRRIRLK